MYTIYVCILFIYNYLTTSSIQPTIYSTTQLSHSNHFQPHSYHISLPTLYLPSPHYIYLLYIGYVDLDHVINPIKPSYFQLPVDAPVPLPYGHPNAPGLLSPEWVAEYKIRGSWLMMR